MKIIISPAKKMRVEDELPVDTNRPKFIRETKIILEHLKNLTYEEAKKLWQCNDKIAQLNYERIKNMDLECLGNPALLSYEGIQYQYMGVHVFTADEFAYLQDHLRILSGFYGVLRPFDGVTPYRLEMQAKLAIDGARSLYDFWGNKLAEDIFAESSCVVNLASKEYSKCITSFRKDNKRVIHCIFGELKEGKVIEKGTKVKMARGEMVRFMAENKIEDPEGIKKFNRLNYRFEDKLSNEETFIFCEQ